MKTETKWENQKIGLEIVILKHSSLDNNENTTGEVAMILFRLIRHDQNTLREL